MMIVESKKRVKKHLLKLVAGLTLQAFLLTNLFFTDPSEIFAQTFPVFGELKLPEAFSRFPAELGKLEAFSLPAPPTDRPFVYIIQDAHESPAAQENICKILSFLKQKDQLDLLLLEGAAGVLRAEPLRPFNNGARDRRFLEELSRRGLVNGAVKFLGTGPKLAALGMEDPLVYRENLETYRSIMSQRDKAQDFLNKGEVFVAESTRKMLDPKIMLFLRKWKAQQEQPEDFGDYLKFLLGYAAQSLKIDWHDHALQQRWPQLVRVFHLLKADLKQDPSKIEKETRALRRDMGGEASGEMEWLQRTVEADALFSHDFRDTVSSPRRMAEKLVEKARARNVAWVRYPALTQFLSFQILQNEIVPEDLFNEIQTLERKIAGSLSRDAQAGAWMEFFQDFYLLKQALSLNLRREQVARFREHFKENWTSSFSRFLGKEALPEEKTVALLVKKVLAFYAQAEAREDAFFSSLVQRFPEGAASRNASGRFSAAKNIVLVTGGYHKEGLKRKIDRFHIPYGVITPRLKAGEELLPYQKIMMGNYAETSTLGPAQAAVMGRSETREMIGETALQKFEATFAMIQRDLSGLSGDLHAGPKAHEAEAKAVRERVFQLIEHLNRLWWLRQEPPAFRDKEHLGFAGDHPNRKAVMGWSLAELDTYKQSIHDMIKHRISEGRLEYVRFAWLARLMNLRDGLYPGEFPEIDATVKEHARKITRQMANYFQLIRGWSETIFFEMFPPEEDSPKGPAREKKQKPRLFGKLFSEGPQIYEQLEDLQESLKSVHGPEGLRQASRELLDLDRKIRDVFSRHHVAQSLADLRVRMHESTLSRFAGPMKVIERNAQYLWAYTSIYIHGSQKSLPQEILLADTVDAVLAIATHKLFIQIERDYESGLRLMIPEIPFSEIVLNIARNAAQEVARIRPKGQRNLRVSFRQHEGAVTLSIRDNGEGISEENLEKIRGRESFTTKARGNGIGLPLSLRQIHELGGTWTVDSRRQSPDREGWTEFTMTFPIKNLSRSEARYVPAAFQGGVIRALRTVLAIGVVAGLLSGCATASRDLVRQQIQSDQTYVLPERQAVAPQTFKVSRDSLTLSLLANDPILREGGLKVMLHQAEKGRLDGSFSIRPRVGIADGKPVFSLGIVGDLPGIGSLELSGVGVGDILSVVFQLAGEVGKFWKGEDVLTRAMVEQAVEIANLDLQITLGKRYLHFVDLAYEIKTREEQSRIMAETLKKIDAALDVSLRNPQATEVERQSIQDLKAEWRLRFNEFESSLKISRGVLAALYAPGALGAIGLSIDLEYSRLPERWKADVAQEQALRDKALAKQGSEHPNNRTLAQGYATRWLAATTQRLEEKKDGFSLQVGGFSFLDSYGSSPSSDLKTAIEPLADKRTKDQTALGLSGAMNFGGTVIAKREMARLKVAMADAALEAERQKIEQRISELLHRMEGHQQAIQLLKERNEQIKTYLAKARVGNAVTEDRLIRLGVEEEGNKIKMLSALQEITRATEELRVLTWDRQGLPGVFASRSEVRVGTGERTLSGVRTKIFRGILAGAMFLMLSLPFVKPSLAHAGALPSFQPSALALTLASVAMETAQVGPAAAGSAVIVQGGEGTPHERSVTEILSGATGEAPAGQEVSRSSAIGQAGSVKAQPTAGVQATQKQRQVFSAQAEDVQFIPSSEKAVSEFSTLDGELAKEVPGFGKLIEKRGEVSGQEEGALEQEINSYRALILEAIEKGKEASLSHYSGKRGEDDGVLVKQGLFFNYSNPFHNAWDHVDALEKAIQKGNVRVDPEFKERVMKLMGKPYEPTQKIESAAVSVSPTLTLDEELAKEIPGFGKLLKENREAPSPVLAQKVDEYRQLILEAIEKGEEASLTWYHGGEGEREESVERRGLFFNYSNPFHNAWDHEDALRSAIEKGNVRVDPEFKARVMNLSGKTYKAPAKTKPVAIAAPALTLDEELAKEMPGFRKLLKEQAETPDPTMREKVNAYRALILEAIEKGKEASLSHYSGRRGEDDGVLVKQGLFFNYSNPFHNAWDHMDALEASIQKGNVRVDPEFKERILGLAQKTNAGAPAAFVPPQEVPSRVAEAVTPIAAAGSAAVGVAVTVPTHSVMDILLGSSAKGPEPSKVSGSSAIEQAGSVKAQPTVAVPAIKRQPPKLPSQGKALKKEEVSQGGQKAMAPRLQEASSKINPPSDTPAEAKPKIAAPEKTSPESGALAGASSGHKNVSGGSAPQGVILHKGAGKAVVNPSKPVALKVPFPAEEIVFSVKVGDEVRKGDLLAKGIHADRENKIQLFKERASELSRLIARGKEDSGILDRNTMFQYQFELAEANLELDRLRAERDADILLAPRAAKIQTLPQGPATDGSVTVQIIPLDEGSLTLPFSTKQLGFDDVTLYVNGDRVIVTDWEAGGFDLAKGESGEFNLTLQFIAPKVVTGESEYRIELIRRATLEQGRRSPLAEAGFHTTAPESQLVHAGVPSIPGVPAGVFRAAVQDGQYVKEGDVLGTILVPAAHGEQIRWAQELVRLAKRMRAANAGFATLSESEMQAFEARAQRAQASVPRVSAAIPVKAPVEGRVQGVKALDGQTLATGQITEAGVLNAEIFLGTSVDPRSAAWSNQLSNEDRQLISVAKGTVKMGDKVSVSTAHGVVPGVVYAVVPLTNQGMRLYSGMDGVVIRVVNEKGLLGTGSAVNLQLDGGALAASWAQEQGVSAPRSAPALRVLKDIPPAIQREFQMHPGEKIGVFRMVELVREEENFQQRFEMLQYFMSPLGFRYVNELAALAVLSLFAFLALPKLVLMALQRGKQRRYFRQDTEKALQRLKNELHEIEMRLQRKIQAKQADPGRSVDAQVLREILAPMQDWIRLVWEHETLGSDERDTITTKASELAQSPLLGFSKEHFEGLAEFWKGDTRYLVKLRGLLARLAILTGKATHLQLKTRQRGEDPLETSELLRFKEKMADFAENFNEGYNLTHRLIALSQVSDLYPPKLKRGDYEPAFSQWGEIVLNRAVLWTFPTLRFLLAVSAMVAINRWVTLRSFRNVAENMQKLSISGFSSVPEAMRVAREGLHKAFHPVANVDELEGNKLAAYYGRWLGRVMVIVGVLAVVTFPGMLALLGLSHLIAPGAIVFLQFAVPMIAIWRHVGPMLRKLSGEGYIAMRHEIETLRRPVKRRQEKTFEQRRPQPVQPETSLHEANARDEALMMGKMSRALLDEELRQSVETIVVLPPKHGEHQRFFETMASQDEVLKRFDFTVVESDGLYPGNVGQFFAARDRARASDKKIKIYWFSQPGVPFSVAMAVFKLNLAEALRMAGDFKQHGMEFGEILFPGGNLSSNAINYTKNGSHIVIDARLASLEEVRKSRLPVLLGRNGSPRHNVEHLVRQPEDLPGVLSQYGQQLGIGLSLENLLTPQFPVSKGPVALVSSNVEERERMETLLVEARQKIDNLTERYGPFPVDLLEDFAGVVAEFRRQFLENGDVQPNLQRLAHTQKIFPNSQDAAQPYGKIYGVMGRTLWDFTHKQQHDPLRVESFVPAPSDYLFVSGHEPRNIQQQIERIKMKFPELVNASALERMSREIAVSPSADHLRAGPQFVFNQNGKDVLLTKKSGFEQKLPIRKAAAFVIKDGNILFQQRDRQASTNPGLLDLPVFEQMEPGETPEDAVRRGFVEELRDGQPLPSSLRELPVEEIERISYQVPHQKRGHVPTTRKEDVSTFMVRLNGEFTMDDFLPGDDAIKVVAYSREELTRIYHDREGVFTPRTFVMLNKFLPRVEEAMAEQAEHGASMARSELRVVPLTPSGNGSVRPESSSNSGSLRGAPQGDAAIPLNESEIASPSVRNDIPEEIRILTAILMAKKILAHQDSALYPKLEASLRNTANASERALPSLLPFLGVEVSDLKVVREKLRELMLIEKGQKQFTDNRVIFLDGSILPEEYFSQLEFTGYSLVFVFDRRGREPYDRISGKFAAALAEKQIHLVYAPDGLSSFIKETLRSGSTGLQHSARLNQVLSRFQGQDKAQDRAFIARDRNESRKLESFYVGHRYYYGPEFLKLDPELVFYSLQLLLRSPELFKEGQGRDGQSVETFLGAVLQRILEAAQSEKRTSIAA